MSLEKIINPEDYINPAERQEYLVKCQIFIRDTIPTGAISDESEVFNLAQVLMSEKPVLRSYVEKILGQLGNPDDRGSLYH